MVDPLTGVFNRRAFFEKAAQEWPAATPSRTSAAVMFDVDHFKRINDVYGHDVGDQVLRAIGKEALGEQAVVGRLGGEEFAVLFDGANLAVAAERAERLRAKLAALSFETERGKISVTCSFGVAERQPGETVDRVLKRADAALYRAKNDGRNRVVAARPEDFAWGETRWSGLVRHDDRNAPAGRNQRPLSPAQSELLARWSDNVEAEMQTMSRSPNDGAGPLRASRAFVLDDEPQIAALVCKVLEACGLQSQQFTTCEPFLAEVKTAPPDLIVLDLALGQSDAVEVIHRLKAMRYHGKVLLISGRHETTLNEITQIGERHGLAMLPPLKKPFRPSDIKERLSTHVVAAAHSKDRDAESGERAPRKAPLQLLEAVRNNWLELWYQPKFDLKSFLICGAEGLVRARHPLLGIITPADLLPPAGDPNFQPLTRFVIERAMADWKQFAEQGLPLRLSVNAPVSVIHTPAFITLIRSALPRDPGFPGLIVEVTEDEVIGDSEWAREVANQLKLYNVALSIDDFGSGFASLSRLNELPFVEVKIDRSFVTGCATNELKHSLCQTVVDLAHRFGATACAEGVETVEELRALMAMGCDSAQGFLFAKPMPAGQLASALRSASPLAVRALLRAPAADDMRRAQSA